MRCKLHSDCFDHFDESIKSLLSGIFIFVNLNWLNLVHLVRIRIVWWTFAITITNLFFHRHIFSILLTMLINLLSLRIHYDVLLWVSFWMFFLCIFQSKTILLVLNIWIHGSHRSKTIILLLTTLFHTWAISSFSLLVFLFCYLPLSSFASFTPLAWFVYKLVLQILWWKI